MSFAFVWGVFQSPGPGTGPKTWRGPWAQVRSLRQFWGPDRAKTKRKNNTLLGNLLLIIDLPVNHLGVFLVSGFSSAFRFNHLV